MFKQRISQKMYIPENTYEEEHIQELIALKEAEQKARKKAEIRQAREEEKAEFSKMLSIKKPTKYQLWTDKQIEFITDNRNKMTHKQMAERLDKAVGSVSKKIKELGLSKAKPKCSDEQIEQIKAFYLGNSQYKSVIELSKAIGRKPCTIRNKAYDLGLKERQRSGRGKYDRKKVSV